MPPFHMPEQTVTLVFDDGPLLGLELEVRKVPLDTYFELFELINQAAAPETGLEGVRVEMRRFAEIALVGWNLENGTGPVPLTPESFTAHVDPQSGQDMIRRYLAFLGGVPGPLARPSASGSTSRERRRSKNRQSSAEPPS